MTATIKSLAGLSVLQKAARFACATCSDTGTVTFTERTGRVQQPCRDCGGCTVYPQSLRTLGGSNG